MRNPEESRKSVEKSLGNSFDSAKVIYEKCDTGDLESVKIFAKKVQKKFSEIHLLINNGKLKKSKTDVIVFKFPSWNFVRSLPKD